jgi:putative exosortase-associated protein (TIGR04073 family)
MRIAVSLLALGAVAALAGCTGPENKFGRGMANMTEIVRGGEMSRAKEQTELWDGSTLGPTAFARGFTRTMARTGIGIYEVVTFPLPPYGPVLAPKGPLYPDPSVRNRKSPWGGMELPEHTVSPDSYRSAFPGGSIFETDHSLGFSGGEIFPVYPFGKFNTLGY